jgi:precorrin-3B C17-methyltransferase
VPANHRQADLRRLLEEFQTVCLLKPSLVIADTVEAIKERGAASEMVYLENVGTASEFITYDPGEMAGRKTYFSLLLVRQAGESRGRKRQAPERIGKVWVIGLGPGDPRLLTDEARTALHRADVIIGYEGYLPLFAPLSVQAELLGSPIGAETERAVQTLELAYAGRRVALVSSGDAGVYGMAGLLLESAETTPGVDVEIVPGVTAATAAAALLGAPLGHDFACVSLSDLLTPWDVIEHRLAAAGQADYVVVVYNPASKRRTWQLNRAREILLQHRRPETPVGLVEKAYRPGQRVWQMTLGQLTTDEVGMETLVIIGNSQTRCLHGRMVTPRGYGKRQRQGEQTRMQTGAGRSILEQSFAIIDGELGSHSFPPWAYAVVRRMIHASADFEFAQTVRYRADFDSAFQTACRSPIPIVADTEMLLWGIRSAAAQLPGITLACHLNDPETAELAADTGLTRSAAGVRLAARLYARPLLAIGNAPTALVEAVRLIEEEGWRPAVIVGMPVGFVGVVEAKERLLRQSHVPYLTCVGRKGGSAVTAAAVNALLEWQGSL